MRYTIYTTVDITNTGVRTRTEDSDWSLHRNQQRNLDTLVQTIGLRCQPLNIEVYRMFTVPSLHGLGGNLDEPSLVWSMTFDVDRENPFGTNFELLLSDLNNVPILNGLEETTPAFPPVFQTLGTFKNVNIMFGPF